MPFKYRSHQTAKQVYRLNNWPQYNEALKRRGRVDIWLSDDLMGDWCVQNPVYDGTGSPYLYSDQAIIACHEIRLVFKLPLRQTEGFINSLFEQTGIELPCPDYSTLSRRLKTLNITTPRFKQSDNVDEHLEAIAIDSTGLKRFGRDEWHQEKYKVSAKRSWRMLHIAVSEKHIIHAVTLTDRFTTDESQVAPLLAQIEEHPDTFLGDGAYDNHTTYQQLTAHSPECQVVIPPVKNAREHLGNHPQRNLNISDDNRLGRPGWQNKYGYGKRNYAELGVQRYKRIIGNQLHAREFTRQQHESIIACGVLNRMTRIGMPESYRVR